eukprot:Hpha_TRINITY_DN16657_c1_g6::TRINITY_DN16657_c1_g6_i1::g.178465::m.178465
MSVAASAAAAAPTKVIFGADWCPHTQNAVKALGGKYQVVGGAFSAQGAQKVKYVNCADPSNFKACKAQNIKGYPTFMTCSPGSTSCKPSTPQAFGVQISQL